MTTIIADAVDGKGGGCASFHTALASVVDGDLVVTFLETPRVAVCHCFRRLSTVALPTEKGFYLFLLIVIIPEVFSRYNIFRPQDSIWCYVDHVALCKDPF